jgi:predicted DNA-binding protein (UPF0251 family)/predicted Fe-Mo cluster-binding NifX family protein
MRSSPTARFYKPQGIPMRELKTVTLKDEEWEAIKLADYKGMQQEEAARLMGLSRPTFSRVLSSARKAVAKALAEGAALEIGGGDFHLIEEKTEHSPKEKIMKVAFTTTGDDLSAPMEERFGRSPVFLVYDLDRQTTTIIENENSDAPGGAGLKAAEIIMRSGTDAVVTGDCGPKASNALKAAGIKIYSVKGGSVKEALDKFVSGQLPEIG